MKRQLALPELQISEKKSKINSSSKTEENIEKAIKPKMPPNTYKEAVKFGEKSSLYAANKMVNLAGNSKTSQIAELSKTEISQKIEPSQKEKSKQAYRKAQTGPVYQQPKLLDQLCNQNHQVQIHNPLQLRPQRPLSAKAQEFNPSKFKAWRTSNQRPMSTEQQEILTLVFNHVRVGSGSPVPIRKIESEFHKLNRMIRSSIVAEQTKVNTQFSPVPYQSEIDLTSTNLDLPINWTIFQSTICSSYFTQVNRWQKLFDSFKNSSWEFILKSCYSKADTEAFQKKATVWQSPPGNPQVMISGEIDRYIFKELFEGGFVHSIVLEDFSPRMVSATHPTVREFVEWLYETRCHRSYYDCRQQHGVRFYSAPPLFQYTCWKTVGEFIANKPEIYPSIHLLQEVPDVSTISQFFSPKVEERLEDNYRERAIRLQQLEDAAMDFTNWYVWRDDKRILCHAEDNHNRSQLSIQFAIGSNGILVPQQKIAEQKDDGTGEEMISSEVTKKVKENTLPSLDRQFEPLDKSDTDKRTQAMTHLSTTDSMDEHRMFFLAEEDIDKT